MMTNTMIALSQIGDFKNNGENLMISSHTRTCGIFKDLMQTVCQRSH
jgi:hypothetical protein